MRFGNERTEYQKFSPKRRFMSSLFLGYEFAYTEEELALRDTILRAREQFINKDYLQTEVLWFQSNFDYAFDIVNKESWIWPKRIIPKSKITPDDFIFKDLPTSDVKWTTVESLVKQIGDYLIIRNHKIINNAPEQLNQPMNFFLLDIASILKKIATDDNSDRVDENLKYLSEYIRKIEKITAAENGSDKLFLFDINKKIFREIREEVRNLLNPAQLREITKKQVDSLADHIKQINHILHFSFSKKEVNPHAYYEYLIDSNDLTQNQLIQFPSVALSSCFNQKSKYSIRKKSDKIQLSASISFNQKELLSAIDDCTQLSFVEELSDDYKVLYGQSILQLHQLIEYHRVFSDFINLLSDTGEVIALINFNQELNLLLDNLNQLIHESTQTINKIYDENSLIYHLRINQYKNSYKGFIKNYDILNDETIAFDFSPYITRISKATTLMRDKLDEISSVVTRKKLLDETSNSIVRIKETLQVLIPSIRVIEKDKKQQSTQARKLLSFEEPDVDISNFSELDEDFFTLTDASQSTPPTPSWDSFYDNDYSFPYHDAPALVCSGEKPGQNLLAQELYEFSYGNIMLGVTLWVIGKYAYRWLMKPAESQQQPQDRPCINKQFLQKKLANPMRHRVDASKLNPLSMWAKPSRYASEETTRSQTVENTNRP